MLDELERLLAQLYTTTEQARHVAQRAKIMVDRIDLDGSMRDVWHRIVVEAEKQRRLTELAGIAAADYEARPELQQIYGALKYATRKIGDENIVFGLPNRDLRPDMDTLNRIERAVNRLDAIVRGNPEFGIDEGLMHARKVTDTKIDTLIRDVLELKEDVAELRKNQQVGRRLSYYHMAITLVFALAVALALWALWGSA